MKPVTVSVTIDRPRDEIYAVLDDLMNHEAFTDHFLTDFQRTETGIYELKQQNGSTVVSFTNEVEPAGVGDRLMAPVIRAYLRKQNGRAMARLKEQMEAR
jgi:hypothetical protein